MTEAANQFRIVLRGYDPAQVERRLGELAESSGQARQEIEHLISRIDEVELARERAEARARSVVKPVVQRPTTFTHLGERVGHILALAEEEAEEIRDRARGEMDEKREELARDADQLRGDAEQYAVDRRSEADTEAARIIEEAERAADERVDAAERDAAARLQEAEAVFEEQRARAAKAATEFETTLANRRKAAEQEYAEQMADTQRRLEEAERFLAKARAEAEATTADAARDSERMLQEARQQADQVVHDAKTAAARIRSDIQRELAAATQRRDSINAQLANVRQMLATLTGGAAMGALPSPLADGVAQDGDPSDRLVPESGYADETVTVESARGPEHRNGSQDGRAAEVAGQVEETGSSEPDGAADALDGANDDTEIVIADLRADDTWLIPAVR